MSDKREATCARALQQTRAEAQQAQHDAVRACVDTYRANQITVAPPPLTKPTQYETHKQQQTNGFGGRQLN